MKNTILLYEYITEVNLSDYIHNIKTDVCDFFEIDGTKLIYNKEERRFKDSNLKSRADLFFDNDGFCKVAIKVFDLVDSKPLSLLGEVSFNDVIIVVTKPKVTINNSYQSICHVEPFSSSKDFITKLTIGFKGNYDKSYISESTIEQFNVEILKPIAGFTTKNVLDNFDQVHKEINLL